MKALCRLFSQKRQRKKKERKKNVHLMLGVSLSSRFRIWLSKTKGRMGSRREMRVAGGGRRGDEGQRDSEREPDQVTTP